MYKRQGADNESDGLCDAGDDDDDNDGCLDPTGGGSVYFEKENWADWTLPENQDCITDNVCLTRADQQSLFNAASQDGFDEWSEGSPHGTQWAAGPTGNTQTEYMDWMDLCMLLTATHDEFHMNCWMPYMTSDFFNDTYGGLSMYSTADDIYVDFEFHSWTAGDDYWGGDYWGYEGDTSGGGGFSYTRSAVGGEGGGGSDCFVVGPDADCNGDCFGSAADDSCGVCSGGSSGHEADSDIDDCGDCFGGVGDFDEDGLCDTADDDDDNDGA